MKSYPLETYRLNFADNFEKIQIVERQDLCCVEEEYALLDVGGVEVVISETGDTLELVLHPESFVHDVHVFVELNDQSFFGLDSLFLGGVGISDLRDPAKIIVEAFDLRLGTLAFRLGTLNNKGIRGMEMLGKNKKKETSMYRQLVRAYIHHPS